MPANPSNGQSGGNFPGYGLKFLLNPYFIRRNQAADIGHHRLRVLKTTKQLSRLPQTASLIWSFPLRQNPQFRKS